MKEIGLFTIDAGKRADRMAQGLRSAFPDVRIRGQNVKFVDPSWTPRGFGIDAVVTDGGRWGAPIVWAWALERGFPVVVLDAGFWPGNVSASRVVLGGLNWLPRETPSKRRAPLFGLERLEREVDPGGAILVLGQKEGDPGQPLREGETLSGWLQGVVDLLLDRHGADPGRVFRFRTHPHNAWTPRGIPKEHVSRSWGLANGVVPLKGPEWEGIHSSLEEDIRSASLVVALNSSALIEALRQGAAVLCHPDAVWVGEGLAQAVDPRAGLPDDVFRFPDPGAVDDLLERVAWAQWLPDEIETAEPWDFAFHRWNVEGADLRSRVTPSPAGSRDGGASRDPVLRRDRAVAVPVEVLERRIERLLRRLPEKKRLDTLARERGLRPGRTKKSTARRIIEAEAFGPPLDP